MTGKPEDFLDTDFILSSVGQAENLSSFGAEKIQLDDRIRRTD